MTWLKGNIHWGLSLNSPLAQRYKVDFFSIIILTHEQLRLQVHISSLSLFLLSTLKPALPHAPLWSTLLSCLLRIWVHRKQHIFVWVSPHCPPGQTAVPSGCLLGLIVRLLRNISSYLVFKLLVNYLFFLFNRFSCLSKKRPVYFILALSLEPTMVDSTWHPPLQLSHTWASPLQFILPQTAFSTVLLSSATCNFFQWPLGTYLFR